MNTCGKRFHDGKGFCVNANHFFRKAVCALRSAAASCAAGACRFMRGGALEQGPAPSHVGVETANNRPIFAEAAVSCCLRAIVVFRTLRHVILQSADWLEVAPLC
jgi:hypothetical protein